MKKIIISVLITAMLVSAGTMWVFKDSIFPREHGPKSVNKLQISDAVRKDVDRAVKARDTLLGVQVVTIHFQRNIRIDTLMSISNDTLQAIYDKFINNRVVETSFFNSDPKNNARMLRLINGEFVCIPYTESIAYELVPAAAEYVKGVCAIGIPPQNYGEFTGIITFYLSELPKKEEASILFLFARELSIKIYDSNKEYNVYTNQR